MIELTATAIGDTDFEGLALALAGAGLPASDLREPGRRFFRFDADELVGYGGLEGMGDDQLLRSLVVLPDRREMGVGGRLLALIEHEARHGGARRLHLLTTTAERFFAGHGYVRADRARSPAAIRHSAQFANLCPASAIYLVKSLEATA